MKKSEKLISFGMGLAFFGGMGLDGEDAKIAYILLAIGLFLMLVGAKKLKLFLFAITFSLLTFIPEMEANAQSKQEQILSEEIVSYCDEIGEEYGICSELLQSIIITESTGNPNAKNGGCLGLMQINKRWHKERMERLGVDDLYDSYSNILVGADYLMELAEKHGDVALVLSLYHGEKDAFEKNEKGIISNYAKKILERSEFLEREHGK